VKPRGAVWRTADVLVARGFAAWERGEKWRRLEITEQGRVESGKALREER
jgi:hypothetical protein